MILPNLKHMTFSLFKKKKSVAGYKLNWHPSPPDPRDFKFADVLARRGAIINPPSSDLTEVIPEVYDQGRVGSCTGNSSAITGLFQSRLQGREISPSRLMLYYDARVIIGEEEYDNGAYIRDIFKSWAKLGVAPESLWPYNESKVTVRPSPKAYAEGLKTLATAYHALDNSNLEELKSCIALGHPFVLGFNVYHSFMYGNWKDTMPMPTPKEAIVGGHAVCAVGYDDARQAFRIKNSWGTDWKDGGHFWMPYAFITNTSYCDDFWMLEGVTPADVQPTPDNITSVVDLKKIFFSSAALCKLRESELILIGQEMGLNTDTKKTKTQNAAIVAGGLGIP